MSCPVVRFEIGCRDTAAASSFYSSLFDWEMQPYGPAMQTEPEGGIGGHIIAHGHEPHNYTLIYVQVPDIEAYLQKAADLGGKTLVPKMDLPHGSFAWIADPDGTMVGLWQPKTA